MNDSKYLKIVNTLILILVGIIVLGGLLYLSYINNWWLGTKNTDTSNLPDSDLVSPSTTALPSITPTNTQTPTPTSNIALSPTPPNYLVKVYFSKHPDSDTDPTKVFSVDRISHTLGVATFAINNLIQGPTGTEATQGYYSALAGTLDGPSSCNGVDFKILLNKRGSIAETGTATVQFCRNVLIPGELAGPRMQSEIQQTLLQFQSIKKVVILNKDGACFADLSGLNRCLQ